MPLPALQDWTRTAEQLHIAAQFLGIIRVVLVEHQSNYLEFALDPVSMGLATGNLPNGGNVTLDFAHAALRYRHRDGSETTTLLNGKTRAQAFRELLQAMQRSNLTPSLSGVAEEQLVPAMLGALRAKGHHLLDGYLDTLDTQTFELDATLATDYAQVQYAVFTALARFRARLYGHMTPIVVWTEHFDVSTLWFIDSDMDDRKPHMSFGFAPFSAGFPRPYLYAYVYPYPPNAQYPPLPAPARWNFERWTGVVVDYDDIARAPEPEAFVEQICSEIFAALRPLLNT